MRTLLHSKPAQPNSSRAGGWGPRRPVPWLAVVILGLVFSGRAASAADSTLSLTGDWRFALGGKPGTLPKVEFADVIELPGTTETRHKGPENPDHWAQGLTRLYRFNGTAWYEREVTLPERWRGRRLTLSLERTKYTQVWLDGKPCGENPILCTPQEYDLGQVEPGTHRLTIAVDNTRKPVDVEMHQMSDNTQGNWNGIIGRIEFQAHDAVFLSQVRVFPDVARRAVRAEIDLGNTSGKPGEGKLVVSVAGSGVSVKLPPSPVAWGVTGGVTTVEVPLGQGARLWDEFHPVLYRLSARLESEAVNDEREVVFGLREFKSEGARFSINGRATFLRGKHDACVFPLTGHPPMDTEGWLKYFRTCREYGINHVRFHTWTPPEAAFAAADELGMYLQPELPFWGTYAAAPREALMPEAERILQVYGNHPSFVMLSLGNECGGSREVMGGMVRDLRRKDPRHLYAQGSNNYFWDPQVAEGDDYWTTVRTRTENGGPIHNVRGSFATVDGGNGHVQVGPPDTLHTYAPGIAGLPVPVMGHEVGQYTVYPNFHEIPQYTGVFRARNLEHWRSRLAGAGMLDQADDFFRASGKLAALCYRADIEAALRTPGFGGFQLLDLQDSPGQGTALVGMLDAFMESKGLVSAREWRQFCSPRVRLARFSKYAWTTAETFIAAMDLADYSDVALARSAVEWSLRDGQGRRIASGRFAAPTAPSSGVHPVGDLSASLAEVSCPTKLDLLLSLEGTEVETRYPLWVYPALPAPAMPEGVTVVRKLGASERALLAQGRRRLLFPNTACPFSRSVAGGFATDFWCWPMFKNAPGTMGLLCDPRHPALAAFPTDFHSDWQWFHIATNSRPVILDGPAHGIRPIVQVVDNLDRVCKLALVFEAKVGAGRLLVCASDLPGLNDPAARQLLASLSAYAASSAFHPEAELSPEEVTRMLAAARPAKGTARASSSQSSGNSPDKAIDGDEGTRWCAASNSVNQWLQVDLAAPQDVHGCQLQWELDRAGYRYVVEGSVDRTDWRVLSDQRENRFQGRHELAFDAKGLRHLRVRITGLPEGAWASIRELKLLANE